MTASNSFLKHIFILSSLSSVLFLLVFPFTSVAKNKSLKIKASVKKTIPNIEGWKFIRLTNGVFTYKLEKDKNTVGVFHSQTAQNSVNWNKINPDTFFTKIIEDKNLLMTMIHIFDWTTNDRKWVKKGKGFELTMQGSYTDKKGEKIYFSEYHFYLPRTTHQILITSPNREFLNTNNQDASKTYPAILFFQEAKKILKQNNKVN